MGHNPSYGIQAARFTLAALCEPGGRGGRPVALRRGPQHGLYASPKKRSGTLER